MDLRALQRPIKERYRADADAALITLRARGEQSNVPVACSVEVGRALYQAEAHPGVGGPGTAACSGDMLLGALAACAQVTCQMVATAMGIPTEGITVEVEGDLDLRGTLGVARGVPVGFQTLRLRFAIDAPKATADQIAALRVKTEQYCVVMQTLQQPPPVTTTWAADPPGTLDDSAAAPAASR
jgi:uncharacterized OsmC-like protein